MSRTREITYGHPDLNLFPRGIRHAWVCRQLGAIFTIVSSPIWLLMPPLTQMGGFKDMKKGENAGDRRILRGFWVNAFQS